MIAQLVEQWTENPCVAGSTPARTTALKNSSTAMLGFFVLLNGKPVFRTYFYRGQQLNSLFFTYKKD